MLLLHGFPQFWWMWRYQLAALAEHGYRAVALDLRGFGASDKPPRGHDTWTACDDAAAIVRSLGEEEAVIVGHGLGGWIAWSTAYLHPSLCRGLVTLSMPHPRVMRRALFNPRQVFAGRFLAGMQTPFVPEREMIKRGYVRERLWAAAGYARDPLRGTPFPSPEEIRRYELALRQPFAADAIADHYRWLVRSQFRASGRRLAAALKGALPLDVLAMHGALDPVTLPSLMSASATYVGGTFSAHLLPDVGHYVPEEVPDLTNRLLLSWLESQP
ncbi:MAG: alpha/beta hydrolase [Actinomycetia bacterium]|nr:alpha/beta hydrolase [Actinomycetes bacterium]